MGAPPGEVHFSALGVALTGFALFFGEEYDEVTRGLLVFRPKGGLKEGARPAAPATLMDIAPTLFDLVGFPADELPPIDGISLRPVLEGQPGILDRPIGIATKQIAEMKA